MSTKYKNNNRNGQYLDMKKMAPKRWPKLFGKIASVTAVVTASTIYFFDDKKSKGSFAKRCSPSLCSAGVVAESDEVILLFEKIFRVFSV